MTTLLKKPVPAALILVALWTVWRLAVLGHTGIPQPGVHDEFSYLLGADTFAHGRLANPTHPLGRFFESPHLLMRPTYSSKYPPAQALFLALGQRLFGSPFYGVLIGNALMLFTLCLMLFAWVPVPWALAVSAMFGLCLWPGMYWTNSYWGGSLAASGGALVLLAVGICRVRPAPVAGGIFAIGALLIFWTRPLEGGVFTLIVLMVFAKELWLNLRPSILLAAVLVLAPGLAWTCYYNQAVTGHPLLLPHVLHDHQYNVAPVLWFLPLRTEPPYSHPRLAGNHGAAGFDANVYRLHRPQLHSLGTGLLKALLRPLWTLRFSLGIAVLLTLLVPVAWGDRLYRKMAIAAGLFLLGLATETFDFAHYNAAAWGGLGLMVAVWAERAWSLRIRNQRVGAALVLLALVSPAIVALSSSLSRLPQGTSSRSLSEDSGNMPAQHYTFNQRPALIERLSALDRRQLVIVRYPAPDWRIYEEWVYNSADIDSQRVVFAHDLGVQQNRALLSYYPDRTALLLTLDVSGLGRIGPYSPDP